MNASGEHSYGHYVIRMFAAAAKIRAAAFVGSKVVGKAEGKTLDDVLREMRLLLDQRDVQRRAGRQDGVPATGEFSDAFARMATQIGKHHWVMLKAWLAAPERTLTMQELATAAGYKSYSSANEKLGRLARMIAEDLDFQPRLRPDGTPIWTLTLATGIAPTGQEDDEFWRWTLRPPVVTCLLEMKI